ncbi:hypothetical protein GAMM_140010 [Gammaproteobacteria bacterium]
MNINKKFHQVLLRITSSIVVIACTQLSYADSYSSYEPMLDITVCKKGGGCNGGNIILKNRKEELILKNTSTFPIIIKNVIFENETNEEAGLVIGDKRSIFPYVLPNQQSYQFTVNATDNDYHKIQTSIHIIYSNGIDSLDAIKVISISSEMPSPENNIQSTTTVSGIQPKYEQNAKNNSPNDEENLYITKSSASKDKPEMSAVKVVEFKEPGTKILKIANQTSSEITVGETNVISSMPLLVSHSVAMQGVKTGSKIPAGESCEVQIQATENASASFPSDNTLFFITYQVDGSKEQQQIGFKVKISYNNDGIKFENPILEFTEEEPAILKMPQASCTDDNQSLCIVNNPYIYNTDSTNSQFYYPYSKPSRKSLVLINEDPSDIVKITRIDHDEYKVGIHVVGDYSNCTNLTKGMSCAVDIEVDGSNRTDMVPIYVTYDISDSEGNIKIKDAMTAAVVIIDLNHSGILELVANGIAKGMVSNTIDWFSGGLPLSPFVIEAIKGGTYGLFVDRLIPLKPKHGWPKYVDVAINRGTMGLTSGLAKCLPLLAVPDLSVGYSGCVATVTAGYIVLGEWRQLMDDGVDYLGGDHDAFYIKYPIILAKEFLYAKYIEQANNYLWTPEERALTGDLRQYFHVKASVVGEKETSFTNKMLKLVIK